MQATYVTIRRSPDDWLSKLTEWIPPLMPTMKSHAPPIGELAVVLPEDMVRMPWTQVRVEVGNRRVELECPFTTASSASPINAERDASTSETDSNRAKAA
jgi:hypothetical protein